MFEQEKGGFHGALKDIPASTNPSSKLKTRPPAVVAPKPRRPISLQSVSDEFEPVHHKPTTAQNLLKEQEITPGSRALDLSVRAQGTAASEVQKPIVPPPRRSGQKAAEIKNDPISQAAPSLKARPGKSGSPLGTGLSHQRQSQRSLSPPVLPRRHSVSPGKHYQEQSLRRLAPHMTGEALANAMVGAHLALSKNASPASSQQSSRMPSRQSSPRRRNLAHGPLPSRSPSPHKRPTALRQTMRRHPSDEDDTHAEPTKRFNKLVHKAPNKHHEGSRKHWRDTITDRERKRYEGVWAANKDVLISSETEGRNDEVLSLVARDIWQRSRLPEAVLEEVWFLVDRREIGRLGREEFVVGLWLIDQRLKGRKLPSRVSDSVWNSVTGLGTRGVKIRHVHGKKKHGADRR
jgi:hypothetical protein